MISPVETDAPAERELANTDNGWQYSSSGHRRRLSYPKETWIAIAAATGILAYLICKYTVSGAANDADWILIGVLLGAGAPLVIDLAQRIRQAAFGSDLLAGLSIVTSALIGEYLAGSIVVLMPSGGTALEQYVGAPSGWL